MQTKKINSEVKKQYQDCQYIVVSGEPRSGTSMMMQTLKILDVPVWGDDLLNSRKDKYRNEHARKLNPKGFYETQMVSRGMNLVFTAEFAEVAKEMSSPVWKNNAQKSLDEGRKNKDGAVKLITAAMMRTNKDHIKKIILCLRNPRDISYSQTELLAPNVEGDKREEFRWPFSPSRYVRTMGSFLYYLRDNPELIINKILTVQYEDMHQSSRLEIKKIVNFLELSDENIEKAVSNIDPSLRRKANAPVLSGEEWDMAMNIYNVLSCMDRSKIIDCISKFENFIGKKSRLTHRWIDEETWLLVNENEFKKLQNNKKRKKRAIKRRKLREEKCELCIACPYYNRNGSPYIAAIVQEKKIKRSKVKCEHLKVEVSLEQCQLHWDQD